MMRRIGVFALALGFLSTGALPLSAQTACREIQITTTRTASLVTVTPLDAIAFPVPLAPATSTVVRQVLICPPGSTPPLITPAPGMIGTPIFETPIFETSVFGTPVFGTPAYVVNPTAPSPGAPPSPVPAVVGTAPADTIRDLAMQSARYDRMVVTVTGIAADVQPWADSHGTTMTAFRLDAQGASIGVVVWGHPELRAGETVRVTGPFYVSTPFVGPSGTPWHDVIEAETLER